MKFFLKNILRKFLKNDEVELTLLSSQNDSDKEIYKYWVKQ